MIRDHIVVGGGSAGCVLARRLSERGDAVLLLEAGPDTPPGAVPDDIRDTYPRSYSNPAYQWPDLRAAHNAAKQPARVLPFAQARVMGGGSSLMGMLSLRGDPLDYDEWARGGLPGWSWDAVRPFFRRLESDRDFPHAPSHGAEGPVAIRRQPYASWPPLCAAIGEAAGRLGYPFLEDMNADARDGWGPLPVAMTDERVSAATAYLDDPVRRRPNLEIQPESTVTRLLFEGHQCVGVRVFRHGTLQDIHARQVVVSAGAIHSPALLLRSGLGPAAALQALGIEVVAHLPGVGQGLQNHPIVYLAAHLKPGARQSPALRPPAISALRLSSGGDPALRGDLQMLVLNKSSWHGMGHGIGALGTSLNKPFSRGSVTLDPTAPDGPPRVDFAFLDDPRDRARLARGLALAVTLMRDPAVRALRHEMFAQGYSEAVRRLNNPTRLNAWVTTAMARVLDGPAWLRRGAMRGVMGIRDTDETVMEGEEWLARTVEERAFGMFHPACSCRMGPADDAMAVLDARCAVRGVGGLAVVDASAMPSIVRSNTNIPTLMMAEKFSAERLGVSA